MNGWLQYWLIGWAVTALTAALMIPFGIYDDDPIGWKSSSLSFYKKILAVILVFIMISLLVFLWPFFIIADIGLIFLYLMKWNLDRAYPRKSS